MLIEIVEQSATRELLNAVEQANKQNISLGALHFKSTGFSEIPRPDDVVQLMRPATDGRPASLYMLEGGDIVITWVGKHKATLAQLSDAFYERYVAGDKEDVIHTYYDIIAHGEDLRLFCRKRLEQLASAQLSAATPAPAIDKTHLEPSADKMKNYELLKAGRAKRKKLSVLIVEDQAFSRKMLTGMLDSTFICHGVATVHAALEAYAEIVPDITFLDIDLPDGNGHALAQALLVIDPDAYIIMVTATNQAVDVQQALRNGAKGFVVKPYGRQKILDGINKFLWERKGIKPKET